MAKIKIFKRRHYITVKAQTAVKQLARMVNYDTRYLAIIYLHFKREIDMFNPYRKQNDVLEKFRIKAHLRSYVKDPIVIDETLLQDAVERLKRIPYEYKDPTDSIATELVLEAYRSGFFRYEDLTDIGCKLVRHGKHRRHQRQVSGRTHQGSLRLIAL